MDFTKIPFNNFLGIKKSSTDDYILELDDLPNYSNHLDTVHASVQFALAEATSGEFLLNNFQEYVENIIPVVRRVEIKYKKPAKGKLYSKASMNTKDIKSAIDNLNLKGRILLNVNVDIFDSNKILTMTSSFEWFIQMLKK